MPGLGTGLAPSTLRARELPAPKCTPTDPPIPGAQATIGCPRALLAAVPAPLIKLELDF